MDKIMEVQMALKQATAYLFYNKEIVLVRKTRASSPLHPLWEVLSTPVEEGAGFQSTVSRAIVREIGVSPRNLTLVGLNDKGDAFLLGAFTKEEFPRIRFCGPGIIGLGVFGLGEVSGPSFSHNTAIQITSHLGGLAKYAEGIGVSCFDFGLKRAVVARQTVVEIL